MIGTWVPTSILRRRAALGQHPRRREHADFVVVGERVQDEAHIADIVEDHIVEAGSADRQPADRHGRAGGAGRR
jgi:hypothetical protein